MDGDGAGAGGGQARPRPRRRVRDGDAALVVGGAAGRDALRAQARVDAVGADEQGGGARAVRGGEGEGEGAGGAVFGDDVGEFVGVVDGDGGAAAGGAQLEEEGLPVDAQAVVAVLLRAAEVVGVGGLFVRVLEGDGLEVEALGADVDVDVEVVEDAEGVGGEHECAGGGSFFWAGFVDGALDASLVECESQCEACKAAADDGDVGLERCRHFER